MKTHVKVPRGLIVTEHETFSDAVRIMREWYKETGQRCFFYFLYSSGKRSAWQEFSGR